jgi:glycosyltransferase involved in cell wall biosynthesis
MNILMMNYEYPPLGGGGGVFNKHLAEELTGSNNITIITSQFSSEHRHEIINNIEVIRVPVLARKNQNAASIISMLSYFPSSWWAGYQLLKKRRFDIVHSMFAIPSAPSGLLLAKKFHMPHVLSLLGGDIYDPSKSLSPHKTPLLHYTVSKMLNDSDRVVALSSDIKVRATQHYNVSKEIDVIHLGIPKPIFTKKTRNDLNFKPDDILLVTVGRLIPRKALQDLINVVKILDNPAMKLIVIGDGPEKTRLEKFAKSLGIREKILFQGHVSDNEKFQLINISDIYVSSSQHEGFGIVFLEAMMSGLPVVCYDNGGQSDFLIDQKTGFLVNQGDTKLLVKRLNELSENPNLRKQMHQFNSHYIENHHIATCANRYQSLYHAVVNKTA